MGSHHLKGTWPISRTQSEEGHRLGIALEDDTLMVCPSSSVRTVVNDYANQTGFF